MAAHGLSRIPYRGWRLGVLASVPAGIGVAVAAAALAHDWRWTLRYFPTDPGPGQALLVSSVIAGGAMLGGLAALVGRRSAIGAWFFSLGVGLICGVAAGFALA